MNSLENELQSLTLIPHFSFAPMVEEDPQTTPFYLYDQNPSCVAMDFPQPSPVEPEKRNFIHMWCNEASFFQGKFSSGATPHITPKKASKPLKNLEIPKKKQLYSEKANKTKQISKKSGFSKFKKNDGAESSSPEIEDMELKTPSPKLKRPSAFESNSVSLKKMKNNSFCDRPCDLDTTNTTDFIEEDYNFLKSNLNNVAQESECYSPKNSRFTSDYEILEIIGKGNFGIVYKCRNRLDGLIYAIKCSKNQINSLNTRSLSLNEAKALAKFSNSDENPYIVRYFHAWIEFERLYLAMEHCNTSLRQLIENTSYFPETQLKTILRDVASGLKVLHLKNVVHLDIKPENILFSQSNKYKIADLGLSRIAISVKGEDIIEGDSRYLAPELLNEVQEDYLPDLKKADIFSLGVTFYELITRRTIPNNGEEWHMIRSGKLVGLETEISGKIKEIVRRMVHPKPEMRPSAEEVLNCEFLKEDSEAEIRWEIMENEVLRSRIKEYERLLGIKRKKSI